MSSKTVDNTRTEFEDQEIIVKTDGPVGILVLNRPQALNALTLEMVRIISGALNRWRNDDSIAAVLVYATEGRAFCAGGDIKAAYRLGMQYRKGNAAEGTLTLFFEEEYEFNRLIYHYEKPVIAFMDGITMGGGYGLAGPCSHRIATNKTRFAMPEVAIGFFPDVGSMYFLNRCPTNSGAYLAVTGNSISGADCLYAGLADHYMEGVTIEALQAALAKGLENVAGESGDDAVSAVLSDLETAPSAAGGLQQNAALIGEAFAQTSVEDILSSLGQAGTGFAEETTTLINSRSPTSLKLSLAYYLWAQSRSFDEILQKDLQLATAFLKQHDFYEGVRAMVIDKDREPRWDPDSLAAVSAEVVETYLSENKPG